LGSEGLGLFQRAGEKDFVGFFYLIVQKKNGKSMGSFFEKIKSIKCKVCDWFENPLKFRSFKTKTFGFLKAVRNYLFCWAALVFILPVGVVIFSWLKPFNCTSCLGHKSAFFCRYGIPTPDAYVALGVIGLMIVTLVLFAAEGVSEGVSLRGKLVLKEGSVLLIGSLLLVTVLLISLTGGDGFWNLILVFFVCFFALFAFVKTMRLLISDEIYAKGAANLIWKRPDRNLTVRLLQEDLLRSIGKNGTLKLYRDLKVLRILFSKFIIKDSPKKEASQGPLEEYWCLHRPFNTCISESFLKSLRRAIERKNLEMIECLCSEIFIVLRDLQKMEKFPKLLSNFSKEFLKEIKNLKMDKKNEILTSHLPHWLNLFARSLQSASKPGAVFKDLFKDVLETYECLKGQTPDRYQEFLLLTCIFYIKAQKEKQLEKNELVEGLFNKSGMKEFESKFNANHKEDCFAKITTFWDSQFFQNGELYEAISAFIGSSELGEIFKN